jgi:hypothetical protein
MKCATIIAIFVMLLTTPTLAAPPYEGAESSQLSLKDGRASAKGHISGYGAADYVFHLEKGQRFTASLKSKNPGAYFYLYTPGAGDPFFDGQDEYIYTGVASESGDFTARVAFMRSDARRGAKATFTFSVTIDK